MVRRLAFTILTIVASSGCALDGSGTADPRGLVDDDASVQDGAGAGSDVRADLADTAFGPDASIDEGVVDTSTPDATTDTAKTDTAKTDTAATDTASADSVAPPDTSGVDSSVIDAGADTTLIDTGVLGSDASTDASIPCSEPYSGVYKGHCYFVVTGGATWAPARDACAARSTTAHPVHLVTLTTVEEWSFVSKLAPSLGYGRWIGLSAASATSDKSKFNWITGESGSAGKWASSRPNGDGRCVVQHSPSHSDPNLWEDEECSQSYMYICERE